MRFKADKQLVDEGQALAVVSQNVDVDNPEVFGLRIVSLAKFLLEEREIIRLSSNPVDEIVFEVFIDNLKVCCEGVDLSNFTDLHPIFEDFSLEHINFFYRFLINFDDYSALDVLVKDIRNFSFLKLKSSKRVDDEVEVIANDALRTIAEDDSSEEDKSFETYVTSQEQKLSEKLAEENLPESFLVEISKIPLEEESRNVFRETANSLAKTTSVLQVVVDSTRGKYVEKLLVNHNGTMPNYGVSCDYISDLINEIQAVRDADSKEFLSKYLLSESSNLISQNVEITYLKTFQENFLSNLLLMFQISRIMFAYNNGVDLSFLQKILKDSERFFFILYENIQSYYETFDEFNFFSHMSNEQLKERERLIRLDSTLTSGERKRLLNLIYFYRVQPADLERLKNVFLSIESGCLNMRGIDRVLLEFLCYSGVNAVRNRVVRENKRFAFGSKVFEGFMTEAMLKFTIYGQNPNVQEVLMSVANRDYCAELYRHINRGLLEKGYIDDASSLKWVNSSDSPLDFLRSTDSFFLITNGVFKDVVIKYDITMNPHKESNDWGSIILRTEGRSEIETLEAFELFRIEVFAYLEEVLRGKVENSPHFFPGLSDYIESLSDRVAV